MIKLRNKAALEQSLTNIKLDFFTNISHELRTPLTLILGPAQELQKEKLSPKGIAYTRLIDENAKRLLKLVNQLLDFRKIQHSKPELNIEEIEMVAFITNVCRNFEDLAKRENINFEVTTPLAPVNAYIDREKMEGVLYNLLSNAFKFTPSGGLINVLLNHSTENKSLIIEVKDNGTGITKEQEASLFNIFVSHSKGKQTLAPGTGIGLALSKEIVKIHNGDLSYRPNSGQGSIFTVNLNCNTTTNQPLNQNQLLAEEDLIDAIPIVHKNLTQKPKILVVEDNSDLRSFIRLQLEDEYIFEEAVNGRQALEKIGAIKPDIILSDIMMPEMDGIQMLDKIKNNFEISHIPVVLLTAKLSIESKIEGLKYGADAYLTKPFNSEQLKLQLSNLLNQRNLLRHKYSNQFSNTKSALELRLTDKDSAFLEKVRQIIEDNLSNSLFKTEDLYRQTGMGRTRFFDKLKALTGLSPIDFIKEYRLNKAMSLLQSGAYNVSETSYISGFTDAGYFSKCFKERFGINPSQVNNQPD